MKDEEEEDGMIAWIEITITAERHGHDGHG